MLSDHDRETLDQIQHRLTADDPTFTSAFDRQTRRLGINGPHRHQRLVAILTAVAFALTALMIVVQAAGPAFFFAVVDCGLIWLWHASRLRNGLQRPTRQ